MRTVMNNLLKNCLNGCYRNIFMKINERIFHIFLKYFIPHSYLQFTHFHVASGKKKKTEECNEQYAEQLV